MREELGEWKTEFLASLSALSEAAKKGSEEVTKQVQEIVKQATKDAADAKAAAENNPVVQAIMKTFPGAKLETVRRKGEETSLVAGLGGGGADDEPPAIEEYPADDDIPESEF